MWRDFKEAVRSILSRPAVAVVVTLTLALAVGANSTIFGIVNTVVLRPLNYPDAQELVVLWETNSQLGLNQEPVSAATYLDWRNRSNTFASIAAYRHRGLTWTETDEPIRVSTLQVSPALFEVLGVSAQRGRVFSADEETPGHERLIILSHSAWVSRFGSDVDLLGNTIQFDGEAHTVVGVMPAGFQFPPGDDEVEVWSPLTLSLEDLPSRPHRMYNTIGRLAPGRTVEQALAEMQSIAADIAREHPDSNKGWSVALVRAHEQLVGPIETRLWFLLGVVAMVLVIGCVNIANILLAHSTRSARDYAVRAALGANRAALIRRSLSESVVLALSGGVASLLVAAVGIDLLKNLLPGDIPRLSEAGVDGTVLGFTALLSIACGLAFGLGPAVRAMKFKVTGVLQEGGSGKWSLGPRARLLSDILVATEMALALVLLVGAGLLLRSFINLQNVDPGFRTHNVVSMAVSLPASRYASPARRQFFQRLTEQVKRIPGVESAGAVSTLPMSPVGTQFELSFVLDGLDAKSPSERPRADFREVIGSYFETMAIPVLQGSSFEKFGIATDRRLVIVNDTFRRRYLVDVNPIGQVLRSVPMLGNLTIIGVVGDVHHDGLEAEAKPALFAPFKDLPLSEMHVVVHSRLPFDAAVRAVRAELLAIDPLLPFTAVARVEDLVSASIAQPRFSMILVAALAVVATILATVGIYGVVSYLVAQRSGEIGLRMALGASRPDTVRLILLESGRVAAGGVLAGLVAAALLSRLAGSFFFGVSPNDPLTYFLVGLALILVALLAALKPALRASHIDPADALRTS